MSLLPIVALLSITVMATSANARAAEVAQAYANREKQASQAEQRVAKSGAIFTRDTSNPKLGEAYRDPSGLIWSGIISDSMNHPDAEKACEYHGARLPTREEFRQLAITLGSYSAQGYSPYIADQYSSPYIYIADSKTEVLPGLSSNGFWSSSFKSNNFYYAYVFNGSYGAVFSDYRGDYNAVRCVSDR